MLFISVKTKNQKNELEESEDPKILKPKISKFRVQMDWFTSEIGMWFNNFW